MRAHPEKNIARTSQSNDLSSVWFSTRAGINLQVAEGDIARRARTFPDWTIYEIAISK